jgi:hypothetical protein
MSERAAGDQGRAALTHAGDPPRSVEPAELDAVEDRDHGDENEDDADGGHGGSPKCPVGL